MTDESEIASKNFIYSYPTCTNEEILYKLTVPIEIPYNGSTRELVQRIINMFHIPVYLENELNSKLTNFVSEETKKFHNDRDESLLNQLKNSEIDVESVVKNWEKLFKENVVEFSEQKGTPDEEVFAAAYHKLVHSPALETILQVENSYAKSFMDMVNSRDNDINQLTHRQTEEMENKVSQLNVTTTEEEINELAARHFEQQSLECGRWGSQLDALWQTQRTQHRAWLMNTLEEYQSTSALNTPSNSPLATFSAEQLVPALLPMPPRHPLEESFTIHLGSQLKQTHNVRIVAMDVLDLCTVDYDKAWSRGHTSLALYSSELCACVLPTHPAAPPSPPAAFLSAARAHTDHHFAHVDRQLRDIIDKLKQPVEKRNLQRFQQQSASVGAGCVSGGGPQPRPRARARPRDLQPGDVFITKHSNLADVHVVFHLIVDDSCLRSDITSRHPAILGLRNILKAACANDVTTVALPLLLHNELTEEMTGAWMLRRAELVLKCVKGFVLEMAGAGGAELRELRLLVPTGAPPALCQQLAMLLPAVFRVATPRKFKPSPPAQAPL